MPESELSPALKRAIGLSLGSSAGASCMLTRCQDIVPRALSSSCKEAGRGRAARQKCMPFLRECQQDPTGISDCSVRCARYFADEELKVCERDCNLKRCKVYARYDECVMRNTMMNVLKCFEETEWRGKAEECLRERCGVPSGKAKLVAEGG